MRISKMRTGLLLLLCIGLAANLSAQDKISIKGKITDASDHEPLIGAQIMVGKYGTVTDGRGLFVLEAADTIKEVTISYLGYFTKTIGLNGQDLDLGNLDLEVNPTSLNEIIVSASSLNYRTDFKGSNFRLSPTYIKNTNPLNTEEVLRMVPGVNIVGDMGLSNRPNISIRGSWGRRSQKVLLMEDGSPAAPAPYLAPGAYYNPVSDRIQAIEVYKGADMLRYGPNNMYGGINYITALPPQKPELRVKLIGGGHHYGTQLVSYGGTWNNLGALVEVVHKNFDGFTDNSSVNVLNLNAKIFATLSEHQSLYFKVSGQYEDNQASLSSITPYTFGSDYLQNPFDADRFTMRRYGLDIIHKWLPKDNMSLTSKIYATDFERDWWRQVSTVIRASEVRSYLGDDIFNSRYSYLSGEDFEEGDYVRVGRLVNGRESITDSRWMFKVSGVQETFNADWNGFNEEHHFEAGLKLHQETYTDRFVVADSSRWARSGRTTNDLQYHLWSASGYLRNEFNFGKLSVTPILRFEYIDMYRQDMLAVAKDPDISSLTDGQIKNVYHVVLPGTTVGYKVKGGEVYASFHEGFIAPSKVFGFYVERDGVLTNPIDGEDINVQPELSWNKEIGWRGTIIENRLEGQLAVFHSNIRNFVAGGENEIFQTPGKMNITGLEASAGLKLTPVASSHNLSFNVNVTLLKSQVLDGTLIDKELFGPIVHSEATTQEFIDRVNSNREAFDLYTVDNMGNEVLMTQPTITTDDFANIRKSIVRLGDGGMSGIEAPYTPPVNLNAGFNYAHNRLSAGFSGSYVASQYTEFMNFESESADGALGKLPSFLTIDAYLNYDILLKSNITINAFVNGKNLNDEVYRASRLNRSASGVFPGGFRQIVFGVNIRI